MIRAITLIFSVLYAVQLIAQEDDVYEKWYAGYNIGMQIGAVINLSGSMHIGRYITNNISIGVGGLYNYYNDARYSNMLELHIWGGRAFVRYDILKELFVLSEYEYLTYKTDIFHPLRKIERIECHHLLIGGGYRILFSDMKKDCTYIMLLYNINETFYTPYSNPVIRVGIEIHF